MTRNVRKTYIKLLHSLYSNLNVLNKCLKWLLNKSIKHSSIVEKVNKTDGKYTSSLWLTLNDAFHPLVIVSDVIDHYNYLSLIECQFIFSVGLAVIQS